MKVTVYLSANTANKSGFPFSPQNAFSSVWWSLLKTVIMMVGEIDYGSIIVDSMDLSNEGTGAPLVPTPHFSSVVVCFFCMMVSVLLMNLLVSEDLVAKSNLVSH